MLRQDAARQEKKRREERLNGKSRGVSRAKDRLTIPNKPNLSAYRQKSRRNKHKVNGRSQPK